MDYTTILYAVDAEGIATATINCPDKMNALNAQVIADLVQCDLASRTPAPIPPQVRWRR